MSVQFTFITKPVKLVMRSEHMRVVIKIFSLQVSLPGLWTCGVMEINFISRRYDPRSIPASAINFPRVNFSVCSGINTTIREYRDREKIISFDVY